MRSLISEKVIMRFVFILSLKRMIKIREDGICKDSRQQWRRCGNPLVAVHTDVSFAASQKRSVIS